jgi:hypothetical protein
MTDHASPAFASPPGGERRVTVRYAARRGTTCSLVPVEGQVSRWGLVRDFSRGGLAVLVSGPLEVGQVVVVRLTRAEQGPGHGLAARVVHVHDQGDGTWLIGCALDAPLSAGDLRALLEGAEGRPV